MYTVDGKCVPPTQEELDIALDFDNMQEVMGKVFELVNGAKKRTVTAESKEKTQRPSRRRHVYLADDVAWDPEYSA